MEERKYPVLDEEESVGMVSESAVGSLNATVENISHESVDGYNGFFADDYDTFARYKADLIEEAVNEGLGLSWNEVRQQIIDRHPWLR